jgi:hypothetical protein
MHNAKSTGNAPSRFSGREAGFIQFLLGNPALLACAALGVALLFTGIALKVQSTRLASRTAELEQVRGQYAAFRNETARLGKEAEEKAKAKEAQQKKVNDDLSRKLARSDADLSLARKRLREQPPVRPDGGTVPVTACRSEKTDGPGAGQWVPLEEYRQLEARALYDAQTISFWRQWATEQGLTEK